MSREDKHDRADDISTYTDSIQHWHCIRAKGLLLKTVPVSKGEDKHHRADDFSTDMYLENSIKSEKIRQLKY